MVLIDRYQPEFTHTVGNKRETRKESYFSPGVNGEDRKITKHPSDSTVRAEVHNPEVSNEFGRSVYVIIYF